MHIQGFIKSSLIEWPGRVSAVVFTAGCNAQCPFCHNKDLVVSCSGDDIPVSDIHAYLTAHRRWIDGIVITGGEPTLQPDLEQFIVSLASPASLNLNVRLDTNGTQPHIVQSLIDHKHITAVAMDIKTAVQQDRYDAACGVHIDINAIKETIRILLEGRVEYIFRTTIVPGIVTKNDLDEIAHTIDGAPTWIWQQFRPVESMIDPSYKDLLPYDKKLIQQWKLDIEKNMHRHIIFEN
jgi:pyruvate formate lyase activating enzyme